MEKLLTIIVPSYNMEKYLPKCLGSVMVDDAELLQRLEVIVVNDGSKDRTSEIAHGFEAKYPGVFRVLDKPNGHYGSCVNAALEVATGLYVKILDADDWFDGNALVGLLAFVKNLSNPVDVIFTDYNIVEESGAVTEKHTYPYRPGEIFDVSEVSRSDEPIRMPCIAYRLRLLKAMHYRQLEGVCFTDTQWCFSPFSKVSSCAYFDKALYRYWVGREGQSVDPAAIKGKLGMLISVLDEMLAFFKANERKVSEYNGRVLYNQLRVFLMVIYGIIVWCADVNVAARRFDEVDKALLDACPGLFDEVAQEMGNRVKPIKLLRRLKSARRAVLVSLRFARRLFVKM